MTVPKTLTGAGGDASLLKVRNLKVHFPIRRSAVRSGALGSVRAVDDVSFDIRSGETLGLVGESGCGKSTTGRAIVRLVKPTSGTIEFRGRDLARIKRKELRRERRYLQMIFQDPYASLNPRKTIGHIVAEPLVIHGLARRAREERVRELLSMVGLDADAVNGYPHQFSGGQRQRISIARALAPEPALVVCDEPVSSLDVSVQAQIVNLLGDLQAELGLTFLFIGHDLSVVRHISDRVAVMYLGELVEIADCDALYEQPLHPYTRALLSAVPVPDPLVEAERERIILFGDVPSPADPPTGCRFHPRCPWAEEICTTEEPLLQEVQPGRRVACHFWEEIESGTKAVTRGQAQLADETNAVSSRAGWTGG